MTCGIYKITNTKNNKVYIGQSTNLKKRLNDHKSSLIRGQHRNYFLQNSVNKYGIENFKFEILTKSCTGLLDCIETSLIGKYKSLKLSLNIENGGNANKTIPQVSRIKMSKSKLGKKQHNNSSRSKKVVCIRSGIIWDSALEASNIYNIERSKLVKWLNGTSKNKSNLRYV